MLNLPLFFAATDLEEVTVPWSTPSGTARAIFTLLGAIVLVAVLLLLWAAFFRRRRRHHSHHHHHHHHHSSEPTPAAVAGSSGAVAGSHKRRRRRRRRAHRPRNPTLAETGGLPPIRSDKPSGPVP